MVKEKTEGSKRRDKGEQTTHAAPAPLPRKGILSLGEQRAGPGVLNSFLNLSLGIQEPK